MTLLADCLDPQLGLPAYPDKSFDHVIMDPPYEAEAHRKGRRVIKSTWAGRWEREPAVAPLPYPPITEKERRRVAAEVVRVCKGWALAFCQAEALHLWRKALEDGGARWIRGGCYIKGNAQPQYSGDRPGVGWEAIAIVWCGDKRPSWNGGGRVAVFQALREGRYGQSAPIPGAKPLELMETLVRLFTNPGDLICDPYAGSGTTGVAALRLGRAFIGWEKKPEHHAIALRRLQAAREQLTLPVAETGPSAAPAEVAETTGHGGAGE